MNSYIILLFAAVICYLSDYTVTKCLDTRNIYVEDDALYVPKFNNCLSCICTNSKPADCEPVHCVIPIAYDCSKFADGNSCCAIECRQREDLEETNDYLTELNKRANHTEKKKKRKFFDEWKYYVAEDFRKFFRM